MDIYQNYYNLLNLPLDATAEEIRSAYFEAARKYHPDVNPDMNGNVNFVKIQDAYNTLANPSKRQAYDESLSFKEKSPPNIQFEITYSQPSIIPRLEEQLIYVLVELSGDKLVNEFKLPPIHICLIIDQSNSMRGRRLNMVVANIRELLTKLQPQDLVSIVAFSDRAEVVVPPTDIRQTYQIESALTRLSAGGATEIYQGLKAGIDLIRTPTEENTLKQLILVTDGHTYGDEAACLSLAEEARQQGIAINALGIGSEWNDTFLDRLTSLSGGNAVYINSSENLARFIEDKIKSLNFTFARQVELSYQLGEGIELTYAFRLHPEATPVELNSPLPLGIIEFGRKTSIILEFKINPNDGTELLTTIASGNIQMDFPTRTIHKTRLRVDLQRECIPDQKKSQTPEAILQALSKLTLYRLQEKAKKDVASGNIQKATLRLQNLATHLLARGNKEFAQAVLLEADHIHRTHQFSDEGDKKIKYGTRSLLMLPFPDDVQR